MGSKKIWNRSLAWIMAALMLVSMPLEAFAAENTVIAVETTGEIIEESGEETVDVAAVVSDESEFSETETIESAKETDEVIVEEVEENSVQPVAAGNLSADTNAGEDIASGTSNHISWVIDANGKLTISGTGDYERVQDGINSNSPWRVNAGDITSAEVRVTGMTDASDMFSGCGNLASIDFDDFDTSDVTNMYAMFAGCQALTNLDLSGFNTGKVTNMGSMFSGCSGLTSLNLSGFNTGKVTNMGSMFSGCSNLVGLNLSSFDTGLVTNMWCMFEGCNSLESLNLSSFDTSNVTDMKRMFYGCRSLESLNLSNFDTSKVADMQWMFMSCLNLTTLNVSSFNTSNVKNMYLMFAGCNSLLNLDLSNFNTEKVTKMESLFSGCNSLVSLDLSNFDTTQVSSMVHMFANCESLTDLDVGSFNTENVTDMNGMFGACRSLTSLDVGNFNTENVTNMSGMFTGCSSLTNLDLSSFITPKVQKMNDMFSGCSNLSRLDISNFDTANVTNMGCMFIGCSSLTSLNVGGFDTKNVTTMTGMFRNCSQVTALDLKGFHTGQVTDMSSMFRGCSSLTTLDVGTFDTAQVTSMSDMFQGCSSLKRLDLSNFDVSNVGDLSGMFWDCTNLSYLDMRNFIFTDKYRDTGAVIFNNCVNLTSIYAPRNLTIVIYLPYGAGEAMFSEKWFFPNGEYVGTDVPRNLSESVLLVRKSPYADIVWNIDNDGKLTAEGTYYGSDNFVAPWKDQKDSITYAKIKISGIKKAPYLFEGYSNLKELDLSEFDTSSMTNMDYMFLDCCNLEKLNFNGINTRNVTSMEGLFAGCSSLTQLYLGVPGRNSVSGNAISSGGVLNSADFDTSKVTNMSHMFSRCYKLESVEFGSGFITSGTENLEQMFFDCRKLTSVDLSSFDMSHVTNASGMICFCNNLAEVKAPCNLSQTIELPACNSDKNWYQPDGTVVENLPLNLSNSIVIAKEAAPVGGVYMGITWQINNKGVLTATGMYTGASGGSYDYVEEYMTHVQIYFPWENYKDRIKSAVIKIKGLDSAHYMFSDCEYLDSIDLSEFETKDIIDMSYMFENCSSLKSIDISGFDLSKTRRMEHIFAGCSSLTSVNLSGLDTSNVMDMGDMFNGCTALTNLDVSHFNTSSCKYMGRMFEGCVGLTNIDVSNFDTSKVEQFCGMFNGCTGLLSIDVSGFDTSSAKEMWEMFMDCSALTSLDLSSFEIKGDPYDFLLGCTSLAQINAPINLTEEIELPEAIVPDVWCMSDGTQVTQLPKDLTTSELLTKEQLDEYITVTKQKTSYLQNEELLLDDLTVTYHKVSENICEVVTGYTTNAAELNMSVAGKKKLEICYNDLRIMLPILVALIPGRSQVTLTSNMEGVKFKEVDAEGNVIDKEITSKSYASADFRTATYQVIVPAGYTIVGVKTGSKSGGKWRSSARLDLAQKRITVERRTDMDEDLTLVVRVASVENHILTIDATDSAVSDIALSYVNNLVSPAPAIVNGTAQVSNEDYVRLSFRSTEDLKYAIIKVSGYGYDEEDGDFVDTYIYTNDDEDEDLRGDWQIEADMNYITLGRFYNDVTVEIIRRNTLSGNENGIQWSLDSTGKLTAEGTYTGRTYYAENTIIQMPWDKYKKMVKRAVLNITGLPTAHGLFYEYNNLESVDLSHFDTGKITNMGYMFYECNNLTSLNLGNFDTSKVTNMQGMFYGCSLITSLDVSNFATGEVRTMREMFSQCYNLNELDLSNFDTRNVTMIGGMFDCAENLTSLNLSSFDLSNCVFEDEDWDDEDEGYPRDMLIGCTELTSIYAPKHLMVSNKLPMLGRCEAWMLPDGTEITELPRYLTESVLITRKPKAVSGQDNGITWSIDTTKKLTAEGTYTGSQYYFDAPWEDCRTEIKSAVIKISGVTNAREMFCGYNRLESIDLSGFDTRNITSMHGMFGECRNLKSIDLSSFDTSNVVDMYAMFGACRSLTSLDLSSFDMSKVTNNGGDEYDMFSGCINLEKIMTPTNLKIDISLRTGAKKDPVALPDWYMPDGTKITVLPKNQKTSVRITKNQPYAEYTVTFNLQGHGAAIKAQTVEAGGKVEEPPKPVADGYIFGGWYKDAASTHVWNFDADKVTGNLLLYAKWTPSTPEKTYTVTFKTDGGSAIAAQTVAEGRTVSKPADPTKTGFTFGGWYKEEVCTNAWDFTNDKVTANTDLFAKWVPVVKTYTVTFDVNGGSEVAEQTVKEGETASKPKDPTRENYRFGGWYANASFTQEFDFATEITADVTIYAKWFSKGMSVDSIEAQTYTGSAIKPVVKVYDGAELLTEKIDYTVTYKNNISAGEATVEVMGKGNYSGIKTVPFTILPLSIESDDFVASVPWAVYKEGTERKSAPTLKFGGKDLRKSKDFEVSYPDTGAGAYIEPGIYTVELTGKGNFTGKKTLTFGITKATLITKVKLSSIKSQPYTGSEIEPDVVLKDGKYELERGVDFEVEYKNNVDAGKATVIITGMGDNYAGVREATFTITGTPITNAKIAKIEALTYTGEALTPDVEVTYNGETLRAEEDYTVSYSKNVDKGNATVIISGRKGYTGTQKKIFKINAYDVKDDEGLFKAELAEDAYAYTKGGCTPEVVVSFDGEELQLKKDYTVTYSNNKKIAFASSNKAPTVTVAGKGNFTGKIYLKFDITARDLNDGEDAVFITVPDVKWSNKKGNYISKPVLVDSNGKKLTSGTDYESTVKYTLEDGTVLKKNDKVPEGETVTATVTGKKLYSGELQVTYRIKKKAFSPKKATIVAQEYTGEPVTLTGEDFTVTMGSNTLRYGTDYEIVEGSYLNNTKIGKNTASVIIKGLGDYAGNKTVKFTIKAKAMNTD